MINAKMLGRALRAAKKTPMGYRVYANGKPITLECDKFRLITQIDLLERDTLALLVKHIGYIPSDCNIYVCRVGVQNGIDGLSEFEDCFSAGDVDAAYTGMVTESGWMIFREMETVNLVSADMELVNIMEPPYRCTCANDCVRLYDNEGNELTVAARPVDIRNVCSALGLTGGRKDG